MKKLKSIAAVAASSSLAVAALVGCGTNNQTGSVVNASTGYARTTTTKLVMATSADYKPYEYHDTSSGQDKIVGFDIDVANEIAKELHFSFTVKDMVFDSLIGALQAHRADFVIAGMTPDAKREKSVDFSNIYYYAQNVFVTKKGSKFTTPASLKGKVLGAQLGSTQESDAKSIKGVNVKSLDTIPMLIQEVKTGRLDAALIEANVAKDYVSTNPDLQTTSTSVGESPAAIAFPKGSKWVKPFNQTLKHMQQDGEMKKLIVKWFGSSKK